jgi:hypothetical protein
MEHPHIYNRSISVIRAGLLAGLFAMLGAVEASAQPAPLDNVALLQQIFAARAGNFESLKGQALPDDNGSSFWEGSVHPFGLACRVMKSGATIAYWCTNAAAVIAAEKQRDPAADFLVGMASGGLLGGDDNGPKTGLSDEVAAPIVEQMKAAFQAAQPGANLSAGANIAAEDQETLVGTPQGQYAATIDLTSLTADGDEDDDMIAVTVYAVPVTRDPMQQ